MADGAANQHEGRMHTADVWFEQCVRQTQYAMETIRSVIVMGSEAHKPYLVSYLH